MYLAVRRVAKLRRAFASAIHKQTRAVGVRQMCSHDR